MVLVGKFIFSTANLVFYLWLIYGLTYQIYTHYKDGEKDFYDKIPQPIIFIVIITLGYGYMNWRIWTK